MQILERFGVDLPLRASISLARQQRRGPCFKTCGVALTCLLTLFCFGKLEAQEASLFGAAAPEATDSSPRTRTAGDGGLGGAAMADFDTLMNLIQQTIEPDSWLIAGGTSSVFPYPSGVYVDPAGHMHRIEADAGLQAGWMLPSAKRPTQPWRKPSGLRVVSLKQLDATLRDLHMRGLRPTAEMRQLAGLSRIHFVKVDLVNEDILLAGPAGEGVGGIELEDLLVISDLVHSDTEPFGCSIEPTNEGILAAQQLMSTAEARARLGRNPRLVVEQMEQRIGPHRVSVFGLNSTTSTALAMVDADEHMKRIGFGKEAVQPPVKSYFDFLEEQTQVPEQSLIRWWFAFSDSVIKANTARDLFELPAASVCVLSERQWMARGGRAPAAEADPAADAFAAEFSDRLPELRKNYRRYARLCAIFELTLALQLGLEATGQPNLEAWLPMLCSSGGSQAESYGEPKTVPGLTAYHSLRRGTVVAAVSGGVKVDASAIAASGRWRQSPFLAASAVPQQTASLAATATRWWWD